MSPEVERYMSIHPRIHAARIVHEVLAQRARRRELFAFRARALFGFRVRRPEHFRITDVA